MDARVLTPVRYTCALTSTFLGLPHATEHISDVCWEALTPA